MKVIFKPSFYDANNKTHVEIDAQESVIAMRNRLWRINVKIVEGGGKYTCIEDSRYKRDAYYFPKKVENG